MNIELDRIIDFLKNERDQGKSLDEVIERLETELHDEIFSESG